MLAITYTALFLSALAMTLLAYRGGTGVVGPAVALLLWVGLVPSSYAVEIVTDSGAQTIQQPVLAFFAIGAAGLTLLVLIERLVAPRRDLLEVLNYG